MSLNRVVGIMLVVSAGVSMVAFVVSAVLGYELLFAAPPEVITVQPVRLASNPADVTAWNFNDSRPSLHPGDALVIDFHTCFSDVLGGSSVSIQSQRYLESFDGTIRTVLQNSSQTFPVGCRVTHSIIGFIPASFPSGTYRIVGESVAFTQHYSRPLEWVSIWFDVVAA